MNPLLSLLVVGLLLLAVSALLFAVVIRRLRHGSRPRPAPTTAAPTAPAEPPAEPTLRSYLRETAAAPPAAPAPTRPTVVSRAQEPLAPTVPARPARASVVPAAPAPAPASEDRPIRILIVDDISDTREGLTKLLTFERDIEVVGTARTGKEGVAAAHELAPDIVLMDINMPDMDGITAAETITREAPRSQLIMMSVQSDADYLRRSMLAGARDFLIKPFGTDDLVGTIHRVYELGATRAQDAALAPEPALAAAPSAGRTRRAYILTVYSPQPGAGCTTLATNLAVAMQQQADGLRVAVVDGNFQFGDVGLFLNLQSTRTIADLVSSLDDLDPEFVQDVMLPHSSGLRVLLAPPRPELADEVTPDALRRILDVMSQVFDVIVIDSWAFLQETTLVSFELCDRLVLVATQEIPTVKNTKLFLETLEGMEFPLARLSLVLNRVDPRAGIDVADIQRSINHPLAGMVPWDWPLATYAVNRGVPFAISHGGSRLARGIQSLIPVLLTPPPAAGESGGD